MNKRITEFWNSWSGGGRRTRRAAVRRVALHCLLSGLALLFVLPFVWMVLTSLKPLAEVGLPQWLPEALRWENYAEVFTVIPFARFYWNSLYISCCVTLIHVFTGAMAAYAFARLEWRGRDKLFMLYLATMMLPELVMVIPNYQLMIKLHLVDSYAGVILPASFRAFGVFLLRQFMLTIPKSLEEAAEIDGASKWRIFLDVILPLSRPGLIALAMFTFMGNYHSFFWPLVMFRTVEKYTLPVGMLFFDSIYGQSTHLLMAAVTMSVAPLIVVFVVLQSYLVRGIQLGAVKG